MKNFKNTLITLAIFATASSQCSTASLWDDLRTIKRQGRNISQQEMRAAANTWINQAPLDELFSLQGFNVDTLGTIPLINNDEKNFLVTAIVDNYSFKNQLQKFMSTHYNNLPQGSSIGYASHVIKQIKDKIYGEQGVPSKTAPRDVPNIPAIKQPLPSATSPKQSAPQKDLTAKAPLKPDLPTSRPNLPNISQPTKYALNEESASDVALWGDLRLIKEQGKTITQQQMTQAVEKAVSQLKIPKPGKPLLTYTGIRLDVFKNLPKNLTTQEKDMLFETLMDNRIFMDIFRNFAKANADQTGGQLNYMSQVSRQIQDLIE